MPGSLESGVEGSARCRSWPSAHASASDIAPEAAMCSAYPAICRGIHSSHSARVIGRSVSLDSLIRTSNSTSAPPGQPRRRVGRHPARGVIVALMKDGTASQTARSVAAHRLEYARVAADYGDPAADQVLTADVADGQPAEPQPHARVPARANGLLRPGGGRLDRLRPAAGRDRRRRLRRPRSALRQAGRPLVRGRPSGHPGGQARAPRPAGHRYRARQVHRGRLRRSTRSRNR